LSLLFSDGMIMCMLV